MSKPYRNSRNSLKTLDYNALSHDRVPIHSRDDRYVEIIFKRGVSAHYDSDKRNILLEKTRKKSIQQRLIGNVMAWGSSSHLDDKVAAHITFVTSDGFSVGHSGSLDCSLIEGYRVLN